MDSPSQKIILILQETIRLLKICDAPVCEYYGGFLEYMLNQLNRPHELDKVAANILKAYGGMGTLNDVTISKGTKVLFDENDQFSESLDKLFLACKEAVASAREAE